MSYYEEVIKEFLKDCYRKGISQNRIRRYLSIFRDLQRLKVNLKRLSKKDIDKYYFYLINRKDWSQWTKFTHWKMFKRICRFVKKDLDFSDWKIRKPRIEPEILTMKEIFQMVSVAPSFRDKLIILLLYESGMRIGELLELRKKDVSFDEWGAIIRVNGKTGVRYVRVVKVAELLRAWIQLCNSEKLFEISKRWIAKMLKQCAKKVGIKKRVYPHLLRHTRATHLAKYLTEPEMKVYFGWEKDSKMPGIYVHLSSRDVDEKIIRISLKEKLLIKGITIKYPSSTLSFSDPLQKARDL